MKIVILAHSFVSDWNHGNAHFLRGLARALRARGHDVLACERWRNWSTDNLYRDHGAGPIVECARLLPELELRLYGDAPAGELARELTAGADVVLVHEFNERALIAAVGAERRRRGDFAAFFHDTHHRAVTEPDTSAALDLDAYDGVLAFGESLAEVYRTRARRSRVWVFHEAADTSVFRPLTREPTTDVVWIGNWGDEERSREIGQYLIEPARSLPEVRFRVHGVRYPEHALAALREAGVDFQGWIANLHVPEAFARARMTLHIPRGPYVDLLPGIPTIRPFEALACGIPLLCTPWDDREGLFRAGKDYVSVATPAEARAWMRRLAADADVRARLAEHGLATIRARHTCEHRAEQLEAIVAEAASVGV
jgi:spore maturation protein CgeB